MDDPGAEWAVLFTVVCAALVVIVLLMWPG